MNLCPINRLFLAADKFFQPANKFPAPEHREETRLWDVQAIGGGDEYHIYIALTLLVLFISLILFLVKTTSKMKRFKAEAEQGKKIQQMRAEFHKSEAEDEFIGRMYSIMEEHLSDSDFSVDDFATEMAMSRSSFYAKVNNITGDSPNKFIKTFRMKKAADLLLDSKYSIRQVSQMVGIKDAGYFSKLFKAEFGMTPKEYKMRAAS